MIDVVLDNIIFSLQRSGGVSLLWQQHMERMIADPAFSSIFYEYDDARLNIFRNEMDVPTRQIVSKSSSLLYLKRYMNLYLHRDSPYIFHSSYYRYCKDRRAINITTVHDFTYERFFGGLRRKVHSYQKYNAILNSAANICVSESTKNDLLTYVKGARSENLYVVYNGVDDRFRPMANLEMDYIPYAKQEYVLYVGDRKTPYKNFAAAVIACGLCRKPLVMVGGGKISPVEAEFLTATLGEHDFVHAGSVTTERLNELYNNAFCLLYPSLYEGFGIPIVEAQKAGCPVIAYNGSSIPEVIGSTPLCLDRVSSDDLKEAMDLLDHNWRLREQVVADGFENAKRFSWQKAYDQTIEVYRNLI